VSAARKAAKPNLFVELPPAFHNPVEYNAEYILIPGGTIESSATKRIEKVPDIYFAKYPVTNKQYRRFIRYLRGEERDLNELVPTKVFAEKLLEFISTDKAYADYLGFDRLSRDAKAEPVEAEPVEAWPDKLKSRYDEDRKFNGEDQPVVGVTWYAARAYCFWLSELERATHGEQPATSNQQPAIYRLPNEIEWERAAAGRREDGPNRKYPWPAEKGEPNEKLANYRGNVGQTTPVGRYPEGATPEGLMDMAGNVWEWQENLYGDKDHPAARAVRGGSWGNVDSFLRCVERNRFNPDYGISNIGFRVVRSES
jgi:formylglycine-generating enzyme required for sulfatase activity